MFISDFDFELPEQLIAQVPLEHRENSRMLHVDRSAKTFADEQFSNLARFLNPDDVLVLNNTKVFPARLLGQSETGAAVEIFLIRELGDMLWETLAKPGRRLKEGKRIDFDPRLSATVNEKRDDGKIVVRFETDGDLDEIISDIGRTPLPPYIKREGSGTDSDRGRYQTVFAKNRGAIAAPTAGLHFSPEILADLRSLGIQIVEITLHVGYGTFEPVRAEDLTQHAVMPEFYEIGAAAADTLNTARAAGRRVVAVGTTTTRALESAVSKTGNFTEIKTAAELTITPGYRFRAVDALLTNFHLPKSSLLILVSTFGGHELIMKAYRHAVESEYRFYSYGDCMLIT